MQFTDDFISGSFHSENVLFQLNSISIFRNCPHFHLFYAILQARNFTCLLKFLSQNAAVNWTLCNFATFLNFIRRVLTNIEAVRTAEVGEILEKLTYLLTYLRTYLLRSAESFLRS